MGETTKALCFNVEGAFITKVAREWFWLENKPWPVVRDFLIDCMAGTDQTQEELTALARKVVYGQAKFIGNTGDGSYALTEDDKDLVIEHRDKWLKEIEELRSNSTQYEHKYFNLRDYLIDSGYDYILRNAEGIDDGDIDGIGSMASALVESYCAVAKADADGITDHYGWLEPDGTFHAVPWCEHQDYAEKAVQENGWQEEYDFFNQFNRNSIFLYGDFLVKRKGWILLHNPAQGIAYVTRDDCRPLTKAQREFLYGYYVDRGRSKEAERYLEE